MKIYIVTALLFTSYLVPDDEPFISNSNIMACRFGEEGSDCQATLREGGVQASGMCRRHQGHLYCHPQQEPLD